MEPPSQFPDPNTEDPMIPNQETTPADVTARPSPSVSGQGISIEPPAASRAEIAEPTPPEPVVVAAGLPPIPEPAFSPRADVSTPASTASAGFSATSGVSNAPMSSGPVSPAPTQPLQIVTGGADQPPTSSSGSPMYATPARTKRWVLPAAIVVLVLVLGGGYAFAFYLPSRPSAVYSKSLQQTGKAADALINYTNTAAKKSYKSYGFSGTAHVKTTGVSADVTVSGTFDKDANANAKLSVDVLGEKVTANVLSQHLKGNTSPDVYLQVNGVKATLDSLGLTSLDSLDGKWISIDHTLIDSYSSLLNAGSGSDSSSPTVPTNDQVVDAVRKVQTVNKQYLFTTDSSKAVLTNQHYIGKETKDGRSVYHYRVGYNSAHLQAYLAAVGTALNSSKLNAWSKATDDKNLNQELDLASLITSVKNAKPGYTFDMWVDTKTKLVHTLQFVDPSDKTSVFTVTQNYVGGSDYPFAVSFSGKDMASGDTETASIKLDVNSQTDKETGALSVTEGKDTSISGDFTLTPSNTAVQVTAPTGAESIDNVITQLLGAYGSSSDDGLSL